MNKSNYPSPIKQYPTSLYSDYLCLSNDNYVIEPLSCASINLGFHCGIPDNYIAVLKNYNDNLRYYDVSYKTYSAFDTREYVCDIRNRLNERIYINNMDVVCTIAFHYMPPILNVDVVYRQKCVIKRVQAEENISLLCDESLDESFDMEPNRFSANDSDSDDCLVFVKKFK